MKPTPPTWVRDIQDQVAELEAAQAELEDITAGRWMRAGPQEAAQVTAKVAAV